MIRISRKTDLKITILMFLLAITPVTPNQIMNLPINITMRTRGMDTVKPYSKKNRSMYQLHCMDQ